MILRDFGKARLRPSRDESRSLQVIENDFFPFLALRYTVVPVSGSAADDHRLAHRRERSTCCLDVSLVVPRLWRGGIRQPILPFMPAGTHGTVGTVSGVGVSTMCFVGGSVRGFARWLCRMPRPFAGIRRGARTGSVQWGHSRPMSAAQARKQCMARPVAQ
jgi:hypothetical protein